jgi:hypothetical protein
MDLFFNFIFHETTIKNTLTEVIKKQTAVTIKGKITTETGITLFKSEPIKVNQ